MAINSSRGHPTDGCDMSLSLHAGFGMGEIQDAGERRKAMPSGHLLQFQQKVGNIFDLVSRLAGGGPTMLETSIGEAVMFSLAHGVSQAPDGHQTGQVNPTCIRL